MTFDTAAWLHWIPHPRLPEDAEQEPYAHRWSALIAVSMGVFLIALDISVVGITAPQLSHALGATATQIQWTFDAYTVVLAGFVVLGSGLAERFGRKGWMQLGLLVFAAGSAMSAFAPNIHVLISGRVVSGLGAAVVFPACLSIISTLFAPKERHRAIGTFAAISALGLTGGPLIGGSLIHWFWWGAAFLAVVPPALLAIAATAFLVPPSRRPQQGPLDITGALLSVLGLGGIVFGVIEGPDRGWSHATVLGPFVIGLLCTTGFILWELRSQAPLFDLRVFGNPRVVGGALAMGVVYFTFNGSQLLLPQYLGYVLDLGSVHIGWIMAPFGLALVTLSPTSSRLVERFGERAMLLFALLFMAIGMAVLALLPAWGGVANVLTGICLYGIGFGVIVAPATSAVMVAIPKEKAGDGSAVNMVSRQIGGALGVAIIGSVASMVYRQGLTLGPFALSPDQQDRVERSLSGVISLENELNPTQALHLDAMADAAMVNGVAAGMALAALISLLVAAVAFFALRQGRPRS